MTIRLALFEDHLDGTLHWPAAPRAVFVRAGRITISNGEGTPQTLEATDCRLCTDEVRIAGSGELWTFEVAAASAAALSFQEQARCILAHDIDLDPAQPVVLRADRVEFPAGMETPRHGHKGAGIRRLYRGRLVAEVGSEVRRIDAGDAWFETGHDPVIGRNVAPSSAFVRALVLAPELHGKPSFIPWSEAEAAKPRGTQRTEYFDALVRLPAFDGRARPG
jgi:quercetin dioxygenase-like cupin family protein